MTNTQEWLPGRRQTKQATKPPYMRAKQIALVLHYHNYCFQPLIHCGPIVPLFCSHSFPRCNPIRNQLSFLPFKLMPFEVCLYIFWSLERPSVNSTARNTLIHEQTTSSVVTGTLRTLLGYLERCCDAKKLWILSAISAPSCQTN